MTLMISKGDAESLQIRFFLKQQQNEGKFVLHAHVCVCVWLFKAVECKLCTQDLTSDSKKFKP